MSRFLCKVLLLGLFVSISGFSVSRGEASGSICVGKLSYPLGDAAGGKNFSSNTIFQISIGEQQLQLKEGQSKGFVDIETNKLLPVSIRKDGKAYSSFKIDFEKYKSNSVCMWLYWPHATWQVNEYKNGKHGCNCFGSKT